MFHVARKKKVWREDWREGGGGERKREGGEEGIACQ